MIEISLGKLVLLALIALIVLGPEKLPGAARTAGALLRRVRSGWDNVRAEVERELEVEEIKRAAREAAASAEAVQGELKSNLEKINKPFAEAAAMVKSEAATPITTKLPAASDSEERLDEIQQQLPLDEPVVKSSSTKGEPPHDNA